MVSAQYREDHGGRCVATANIKGRTIEVAYGYDITVDKWRFHVYVEGKKLQIDNPIADSDKAAVEEGFRIAEGVIG